MLKKVLVLPVLALFLSSVVYADSLYSTTANFEPSVRASGMGGVFVGFDDDVFGHYYNPAISVNRNALGLTYDMGIDKQNTGALALGLPHLWRDFNFGVSAVYYNAGSYEFWDPVSSSMYSETIQQDWLGVVNISKDFCYGISAGANIKFMNSKLVDSSASSMLFDLGALWRQKRFELGASIQNFGGSLKYGSDSETIASTFRVGGSVNFSVAKQLLTVGADFVQVQDLDAFVRAGAEFLIEEMFAVRAGYEYSGDEKELATGASIGLGVKLDNFKIDYAFLPFESSVNDSEHKFGLTYFFGKTVEHVCYAHKGVHGENKEASKEVKSVQQNAAEQKPVEEVKSQTEPEPQTLVEQKTVKKEPVMRVVTEKANESDFRFDSYKISDVDKEKIKAVAKKYKNDSNVQSIRVEGHTDDVGTLEYNQTLSEKRAQAAADILIAEGTGSAQVVVRGYGKERPIADNATEEGAAQNRRVDIYIDELQEISQ